MFLQERLFQRHLNCLLNVFLTDTEKFIYIFEKFINTSAAYSFPSSNCQIFSHFPTKQTPRSFYPLKQQQQKNIQPSLCCPTDPEHGWRLPWIGLEITSVTSWKKVDFSSSRSYRSQTASQLEVGLNDHFPSSILRILKTKNVKNLFSITINQFIQI